MIKGAKDKVCNIDTPEQVNIIINKLVDETNFKSIADLNEEVLNRKGLYCIRLKLGSSLPKKYQDILERRQHKYIYVGKAERTLRQRLEQELMHKRPGTFFRSIGCVLGYEPIVGHLIGMRNQNNYKFSTEITNEIIEWLGNNIEVSIINYDGNFGIEKSIIEILCPLLNIDNNPLVLQELNEDRQRCRDIARGI